MLQFVFTLQGIFGPGFGFFSASIIRLYIIAYLQPSVFSVVKSALTVFLTLERAPGPSETEGTCLILGGWRFAWVASARCVVFTVSPCLIIFLPCPLIIDQVWSCGSGGTMSGQVMKCTAVEDATGNEDKDTSALGEKFGCTPMVLRLEYNWIL